MKHRTHSPLALPFEEALEPSKLLSQITTAAENQVRDDIAACANEALAAALAGAKLVLDSGTMRVVFQDGIPAGAKLMKSAGKTLPVLVDGKTGKTLSIARGAGKARTVASTAASTALIVVEVAHMISGYDNAQRLKKVEKSVDQLLHAHRSEVKSRLEAIYRFSKELLHDGPEALTLEDRRRLHDQCQELFQLRARWRDDFRHQLNNIDPAKAGLVARLLRKTEKNLAEQRRQKAAEATAALEHVQLMHFSLTLQMALAGAAGRIEAFRSSTLEDEAHAWRSLATFGRTRAAELGGQADPAEFLQFIGALEELADFWSPAKHARQSSPQQVTAEPPPQSAPEWAIVACTECGVSNRIATLKLIGHRAICGSCRTALPEPALGAEVGIPYPPDGWTPESYAAAHQISEPAAWRKLRLLVEQRLLREVVRDRQTHYCDIATEIS